MLGAVRAILFDFDGTIVDTEPLHLEAFRRVLGPRGVTIADDDYRERYLFGSDRECLERMLGDYDRPDLRPELDDLLRRKLAAFDQLVAGGAPLFPGARDFLEEAREAGPLAIVTGSAGAAVRGLLSAAGLTAVFAAVVTAEDCRRGKPDPEPYRLGIERLRRHSAPRLSAGDGLAIEDSPNGIVSARSAGLRTLALAHSVSPVDLAAADHVARTWTDVRWPDLYRLFE